MKFTFRLYSLFAAALSLGILLSCDSESSKTTSGSSASCDLEANTTATSTQNSNGCYLRTRDTSSCQASRVVQGLSGFWLKFSCRVTLTKSGSTVTISTDGLPDYKSAYFQTTDSCYEAFSANGRFINPNIIAEQSISMAVPYTPSVAGSETDMQLGIVGIALNGVAIYSNEAAPGDSIYDEVASFDKCDGHPDQSGTYHFHIEPPSITNSGSEFVGVMKDGFPIYGIEDMDGTTPNNLDAETAIHNEATIDSAGASVYHYHVNLQTDGSDSAYFITGGKYSGTAGTCTGC